MSVCRYAGIHACMDAWMYGWTDEYMHGCTMYSMSLYVYVCASVDVYTCGSSCVSMYTCIVQIQKGTGPVGPNPEGRETKAPDDERSGSFGAAETWPREALGVSRLRPGSRGCRAGYMVLDSSTRF